MRLVRRRFDHQRYLTRDDLAAVLRTRNERDLALFLVMFVYALRASEPGLLLRADWRDARGELYVRRVKGSICATHATPTSVDAALRAWDALRPASRWLFPGGDPHGTRGLGMEAVRDLYRRAAQRAGLSPRAGYVHILKHTRCTLLRQDGARPEAIKEVAGHVEMSSTYRYFQYTEEDSRAVVTATDSVLAEVVPQGEGELR